MTKSKILLITSQFNDEITSNLLAGARRTLLQEGWNKEDLTELSVAGSFELPMVAAKAAAAGTWSAIICLGCIIKGETDHYDYLCQAVSQGIMSVSIRYKTPVIFGVLTTQNAKQAHERSSLEIRANAISQIGEKRFIDNKGQEAASAALLALKNLRELESLAI